MSYLEVLFDSMHFSYPLPQVGKVMIYLLPLPLNHEFVRDVGLMTMTMTMTILMGISLRNRENI